MVEYYNNTLCIRAGWLFGDGGIITKPNYDAMSLRSKFKVVRRASRATPALVEFDTMPFPLKKAITDKVGDPRRLVGRNAVKELIKADPTAMEYFSGYQLSDGRNLPPEVVTEYYNNATVLNAVNTMLNDTKSYRRSHGGAASGSWKIVADAVSTLDRNEVPHTLPANERRLKDKLAQYLKEGYASLIHRGYCNQNSRVVTEQLEQLLLSICCMENKPYAEWVHGYYLQFIGGGVDIVDMRTGELFDRNDFRDENGDYIVISESTVWNYINNPKNAAIIEATRMTNHRYLSTVRPHYHRHAPLYSLSKITLDDRDLPRKMHDGSRVKAYYAYDVASGALIGAAYSRRKDAALFVDCVRDMFRYITANGWGMPMEIEVEHHLVKEFKDDLAQAGVLFPFVRFCAPGNSQEKHAEQLNRQKKYGYEKRYQNDIGRFYAKDEVNRSGGERVYDDEQQKYVIREQTYTFEQLVADDLEANARYNAGPHRNQDKHAGKSRLQVLQDSVNPNLAEINPAMLMRYIGECTTTSIVRNMYVQVQYAKYQLPDPEVLSRLQPNSYTVKAYYLPDAEGDISRVFLYQNGEFLCEAAKLTTFNTAQAERTDADTAAMTAQAKYIAQFDKMVREAKADAPKVRVLEKTVDFAAIEPDVITVEVEQKHDFEEQVEYSEEYVTANAFNSI
jgi:hypothetical protein